MSDLAERLLADCARFAAEVDRVLTEAGIDSAGDDLLDRLREAVLPTWMCRDGEGRRWRIVHPELVHVDPGAALDEGPPLARCIPVSDSAGNPL